MEPIKRSLAGWSLHPPRTGSFLTRRTKRPRGPPRTGSSLTRRTKRPRGPPRTGSSLTRRPRTTPTYPRWVRTICGSMPTCPGYLFKPATAADRTGTAITITISTAIGPMAEVMFTTTTTAVWVGGKMRSDNSRVEGGGRILTESSSSKSCSPSSGRCVIISNRFLDSWGPLGLKNISKIKLKRTAGRQIVKASRKISILEVKRKIFVITAF